MGKKSREKQERRKYQLGSFKVISGGQSPSDYEGFIVNGEPGDIKDVFQDLAEEVSKGNRCCTMCGSPFVEKIGTITIPDHVAQRAGLNRGAIIGYALCSNCDGVSNEELGAQIEKLMFDPEGN